MKDEIKHGPAILAFLLGILVGLMAIPARADVQCKKYPSTDYPPQIVTFGGNRCPIGWTPA